MLPGRPPLKMKLSCWNGEPSSEGLTPSDLSVCQGILVLHTVKRQHSGQKGVWRPELLPPPPSCPHHLSSLTSEESSPPALFSSVFTPQHIGILAPSINKVLWCVLLETLLSAIFLSAINRILLCLQAERLGYCDMGVNSLAKKKKKILTLLAGREAGLLRHGGQQPGKDRPRIRTAAVQTCKPLPHSLCSRRGT